MSSTDSDPEPSGRRSSRSGATAVAEAEQDREPSAFARDEASPMAVPKPVAGLGLVGWIRWAWRLLISMRTALILLLLLALAAIPGSVLPQRVADPLAVSQYLENNPNWGPIADRLGLLDVYASPWFAAIYILLFLSLVGCVVPRIGQLWRQWRGGPNPPPVGLARRHGVIKVDTEEADAVLDRAATHLRDRRWRVSAADGWVSAEKGFLREVGNLTFHLTLIGVLIAVGIGGLFGWRGNVIVREGSGFSNTLTQYDAWGGGRFVDAADLPPFAFTLDDFDVRFERGEAQRGAPRDFTAEVTVYPRPDSPGASQTLQVNAPLSLDGAKVFLIGHGYAPRIVVRDAAGGVVFDDAVVFLPQDGNFTSTGVVKVPDSAPQLGFNGIFTPTSALDEGGPFSTFPDLDNPGLFLAAFAGALGLDDGEPQSIYSLDTTTMEQIGLRGISEGETWQLDNGFSVEFVDVQRWISVQISHDPGQIWALVSALLVIAGLMVSLFVPRRRIWLRRTTSGGVVAFGLARTENARPEQDLTDLLDQVGLAQSPRVGDDEFANTPDPDLPRGTAS